MASASPLLKPSSGWTFTFSTLPKNSLLDNPHGYRTVSDKALIDEVVQASAQAKSLSTRTSDLDGRRQARKLIATLREKAWQLTWGPIKSLGMNLLMLYFGGGDPGIFTVLIISYALRNAFKTLVSVNQVFQHLEDAVEGISESRPSPSSSASMPTSAITHLYEDDGNAVDSRADRNPLARFLFSPFVLQKIVFVAICSIITSYIVYHAAWMGIIPWRSGDFLGLIPERLEVDQAFWI